jgi:hypothetical protein
MSDLIVVVLGGSLLFLLIVFAVFQVLEAFVSTVKDAVESFIP